MPLAGSHLRFHVLLGLPLAFGVALASAETVKDEALGFRFEAPNKWKSTPIDPGDTTHIHKFADREGSAMDPATVLHFIRKHRVVAQAEDMSAEDFLAGTGMEPYISDLAIQMSEFNWRGLPLDQMRATAASPNGRMVLYAVCFPFSGEAVQLQVAGPEKRDTQVRATFEEVARSVENLKPLAGLRPAAAGGCGGALLAVVLVMVLLVGGGVSVAMRFQKRAMMRMAAEDAAQQH